VELVEGGREGIPDRPEEASVAVPVDSFQRFELDLFDVPPGAVPP